MHEFGIFFAFFLNEGTKEVENKLLKEELKCFIKCSVITSKYEKFKLAGGWKTVLNFVKYSPSS